MPFEPETVKLIGLWSNNPKQVRKFIGIILNARKAVQEERHINFILDDEQELQTKIVTLLNVFKSALLGLNTNPCFTFNHLISQSLLA